MLRKVVPCTGLGCPQFWFVFNLTWHFTAAFLTCFVSFGQLQHSYAGGSEGRMDVAAIDRRMEWNTRGCVVLPSQQQIYVVG